MGKLTDSLKAATKQLDDIKHGIGQMTELGQELVENTLVVADTALRAGYAYAKAEADAISQVQKPVQQPALPSASHVLEAEHLNGEPYWTEQLLKKRFKTCQAACDHLRDTYSIKLNRRSWKLVVDAFNGASTQPSSDQLSPDQLSSDQRIAQLEQTVTLQAQRISNLETRLDEMAKQLQQTLAIAEQLANHG